MTLTPDELREHVTTDLGDDALQRLIDAAEAAIDARIGSTGARTEIVPGGSRYVSTSRPVSSVTSVTETRWDSTLTLDSSDFRLRADGYLLERVRTGPNPRSDWWGDVTIHYTPVDDDALRTGVAIELLKLLVATNPGKTAEQIGAWLVQYSNNAQWNATAEYESILSRLDPDPGMLVVGGRW